MSDEEKTEDVHNDDEKTVGKSIEQQIVDAIYANDIDNLQMLLLEDHDLNKLAAYGKKGNEKITPLFIACAKKNLKAVKLLLKFKAEVNVKSFPGGNTPVHIAAMWCQHKIVAALLKAGANPVANNNKNKNPLQIIGNKYSQNQQLEADVIEGKMETQIMLLEAGGKKADNFQEAIDTEIADAVDGLENLKIQANARIKTVEKRINKTFDATHPYLFVKLQRMKAWKQKNKCTVQEYLHKRYIKVSVPQWDDKENDVTHVDLSKVATFQIAIAKELLSSSGLNLLPEHKPERKEKKNYKKEKGTKKK